MPGQAPYDKWSLVHVASGAALGLLGVPGHWMLAALLGFEVLEAGLRRIPRRSTGGGLFEPESWANVGADVVVGALGWYATAWWAPLASW